MRNEGRKYSYSKSKYREANKDKNRREVKKKCLGNKEKEEKEKLWNNQQNLFTYIREKQKG